MATANKTMSATKVVIPCRISFANIFEPKSINGSEAKYSVSCLIPKTDPAGDPQGYRSSQGGWQDPQVERQDSAQSEDASA